MVLANEQHRALVPQGLTRRASDRGLLSTCFWMLPGCADNVVEPLVGGFTTKIPSPRQRLRVLVYPSGLDVASSPRRLLSTELRRRREVIGTR